MENGIGPYGRSLRNWRHAHNASDGAWAEASEGGRARLRTATRVTLEVRLTANAWTAVNGRSWRLRHLGRVWLPSICDTPAPPTTPKQRGEQGLGGQLCLLPLPTLSGQEGCSHRVHGLRRGGNPEGRR